MTRIYYQVALSMNRKTLDDYVTIRPQCDRYNYACLDEQNRVLNNTPWYVGYTSNCTISPNKGVFFAWGTLEQYKQPFGKCKGFEESLIAMGVLTVVMIFISWYYTQKHHELEEQDRARKHAENRQRRHATKTKKIATQTKKITTPQDESVYDGEDNIDILVT